MEYVITTYSALLRVIIVTVFTLLAFTSDIFFSFKTDGPAAVISVGIGKLIIKFNNAKMSVTDETVMSVLTGVLMKAIVFTFFSFERRIYWTI